MDFTNSKIPTSHGSGEFSHDDFCLFGQNVIIEPGVLVFHPENISLYDNVYIGHNTILKGYYKNEMIIGEGTWIGQACFFHSAGGINIGRAVGIGPSVKIITSVHEDNDTNIPVLHSNIVFKKVVIKDGADIGTGSVILPGVVIGEGAIIGAGSVVTKDIPANTIWAGVPAKFLRYREES